MVDETVIEEKSCRHCSALFPITDRDMAFYEKVSPIFGGKKYLIPSPMLCPDCRCQRRLSFRNERKLYHRKCDMTGNTVISNFSPDGGYVIYTNKERFSDKRDALSYGRDFYFNQSFFSQFGSLLHSVPQISLLGVGNENCDYCNHGGYSKNCYLSFDYGRSEDSGYISRSYRCKNSWDISYSADCENSYYLLDCDACVQCHIGVGLGKCYDCHYCYACSNCSNCRMCSNLVNKQYYIRNKQFSKEEYYKEMLMMRKNDTVVDEFMDMIRYSVHPYAHITLCENVTGNYLARCKNCKEVYGAKDTEDSCYVIDPMIVQNIYDDAFSGNNCSFTLETIGCENLLHSQFCYSCWAGCSNLIYCHFCHSCNHCFGCVGLRNKQYCLFNKQYSKEEYELMVGKIIDHMVMNNEWGDFFPSSVSPFCYNESLADEYYPWDKYQALEQGFRWMDNEYAVTVPSGTSLLNSQMIKDLSDQEILHSAIVCEVTGKPFRIIKQELDFYRKHNIPLPRRHPDQRHLDRMKLRNPRKLFHRQCDKCGVDMQTTYAPERPETVYCEKCYSQEVYG